MSSPDPVTSSRFDPSSPEIHLIFGRFTRRSILTSLIVMLIMSIFFAVGFLAVRTKSAIYDEPHNVVDGWVISHLGDYRINPGDPPLWKYWAALPNGRNALKADPENKWWKRVRSDFAHQIPPSFLFSIDTLYRTPGTDADAVLLRSRAMMLIIGIALGLVIARWSYLVGGSVAAIAASLLIAFDPNFLAHSALVKGDVPSTLTFIGVMYALWCLGQKVTWQWIIAAALLLGAACLSKFSAVFLGPIIAICLAARALMNAPWVVLGRPAATRLRKFLVAGGLFVLIGIGAYATIWAGYGFRFAPLRNPTGLMDLRQYLPFTATNAVNARHFNEGKAPATTQEIVAWQPPASVRGILWADDHKLLPQAWLGGLLITYAHSQMRNSFLNGEVSLTGWRYYFPLAMAYKTPIGTSIAGLLSIMCIVRWRPKSSYLKSPQGLWLITCLATPVAIYGLVTLMAPINLGLRHILQVYPFIFIVIALVAAKAWKSGNRSARVIIASLAVVVAIETLSAFPDYIAFFNIAAGGPEGGLKLLGDSNLDWGQDLPLLAAWQKEHPKAKLYLSYFGTADPAYYGIRYINVPGGYMAGPKPQPINVKEPGTFAISATNLQGIYYAEPLHSWYLQWQNLKISAILGGTIYIYDFQPPSDQPSADKPNPP